MSGAIAMGSNNITGGGTITGATVRATSAGDAGISSTTHAFQAGTTASTNIIIDGNEIMARDNGALAMLNLNPDGGTVSFHNNTNSSTIDASGNALFAGGIGSGAITSTGKIAGEELEGTSLDINGAADISGAVSIGSTLANNEYSLVTVQGRKSHMFSFTGNADHTLTLNSGSYYQAEVTITAHQTNAGTYNNIFIRGIWSNNHETHHWDELERVGSCANNTITITNGQNGSTANSGQLAIVHDYVSGESFGGMTVNVIEHFGASTHVIS